MTQPSHRITEPQRELPVSGHYDVVVAGGGIAGVAAAVAAARLGASTCLLERTFALGGLATLGNVVIWLPICDGRGHQVMGGIPEELLKLSVADLEQENLPAHFRRIPACWLPGGDPEARKTTRYQVEFNPSSYLLALESWLLQAGVTLLYDTRVCNLRQEAGQLTHLIVENKGGRSAIACRTVVDATGDADIAFLAGETTESLDSNVLAGWFYHLEPGGLHLHCLTNHYSPLAVRQGAKGPFFRGDDPEQVTAQLLGSRELVRKHMDELRRKHPDGNPQVIMPATLPCFRMTRRLVSSFSLGERHQHEWFDDTIGLTGDWRREGPVYAIPWRSVCAVKSRNLLVAGRCISVDTTVWDVMRAIPTCALTGAATGIAAALGVQRTSGNLQALPVADLQHELRQAGFLLDPAVLGSNRATA